MTVLADLVGDLSWGLKAAWVVWGTWVAVQLVWLRRARVEASSSDAASRDPRAGRSPLSIAVQPDRVRVSRPSPARSVAASASVPESSSPLPAAVSAVEDGSEPVAAQLAEPEAPRQKRRRRSAPEETPSVVSSEAV